MTRKKCNGCLRVGVNAEDDASFVTLLIGVFVGNVKLDAIEGDVCSPACIAPAMRAYASLSEKTFPKPS